MIQNNRFIFKIFLHFIFAGIDITGLIQSAYFKECEKINLNKIECPYCHHKGCFKVKGYYKRYIIICGVKCPINIKRIICMECHRSHAIFFNDFIPYSRLSSIDYKDIIINNFESEIYSYDYLYYLKQRVKIFSLRIKPILLKITEEIEKINSLYIPYSHNSYMQIHKGNVFI